LLASQANQIYRPPGVQTTTPRPPLTHSHSSATSTVSSPVRPTPPASGSSSTLAGSNPGMTLAEYRMGQEVVEAKLRHADMIRTLLVRLCSFCPKPIKYQHYAHPPFTFHRIITTTIHQQPGALRIPRMIPPDCS
jgi:hypothetical protein